LKNHLARANHEYSIPVMKDRIKEKIAEMKEEGFLEKSYALSKKELDLYWEADKILLEQEETAARSDVSSDGESSDSD